MISCSVTNSCKLVSWVYSDISRSYMIIYMQQNEVSGDLFTHSANFRIQPSRIRDVCTSSRRRCTSIKEGDSFILLIPFQCCYLTFFSEQTKGVNVFPIFPLTEYSVSIWYSVIVSVARIF